MSETNKLIFKKVGEVLLTALVSAGIAFLQNIANAHGVECGPRLDPTSTAQVGASVSALKVSLQMLKGVNIV